MIKVKGFTLVEIMIVVLIVALLAAMAVPNLLRVRLSANDAAAQATLKAVSTALENYASINNIYPPDTTELIGATPPYVPIDYFTGTHSGFTFTSALTNETYLITATPGSSSLGSRSFTMSTGGVLTAQ